jgi:hypothetical protein
MPAAKNRQDLRRLLYLRESALQPAGFRENGARQDAPGIQRLASGLAPLSKKSMRQDRNKAFALRAEENL